MNTILKKDFNFEILQELVKRLDLIERLHSSLIGFDETCNLSFRKGLGSSSLPVALRTFVLRKLISMPISTVFVKSKVSLKCL